jgi:cell division septation protein DedD
MNRIITILVTIFILLLLYIWISHVWGSDSPKRPRQIVDATEAETLGADDPMQDADPSLLTDTEMPEENPYEEVVNDDVVMEDIPVKSEPVPEPDKKEVVEEKKTEPKTETKPVTKPETKPVTKPKTTTQAPAVVKTSQPAQKTTTTVESTGDGKHLVIVGNFLQRDNAEQRLQELKKAGFSNVEIVNFDLSEYHAVSAGRFDDVNEARRLVKKLKDYHKIDAYVRIGS